MKDESATVTARYTCSEDSHLWVSAMQMNDGLRDPALLEEGSSAHADNWLQQRPQTLVCDGKNHAQSRSTRPNRRPGAPTRSATGSVRKGLAA
jgi:hypothetical protein